MLPRMLLFALPFHMWSSRQDFLFWHGINGSQIGRTPSYRIRDTSPPSLINLHHASILPINVKSFLVFAHSLMFFSAVFLTHFDRTSSPERLFLRPLPQNKHSFWGKRIFWLKVEQRWDWRHCVFSRLLTPKEVSDVRLWYLSNIRETTITPTVVSVDGWIEIRWYFGTNTL